MRLEATKVEKWPESVHQNVFICANVRKTILFRLKKHRGDRGGKHFPTEKAMNSNVSTDLLTFMQKLFVTMSESVDGGEKKNTFYVQRHIERDSESK